MTEKLGSVAPPPADHTYKLDPVSDIPRHAFKERPDPSAAKVAMFEAKASLGFVRKGGKHVAWSGPLQRNGRLKVFHEETQHDAWLSEQNCHQLIEVADKVLHGRNATVFEGLVLAPLRGQPKRTVESLASQFGVDAKRIYRVKNDCVERIKSELKKTPTTPAFASPWHLPAHEVSETCAICHRSYALSAWPSEKPSCRGRFGDGQLPPDGDINPECLIARREAMWATIKAGMTPEKRAELAAKYAAKLQAQADRIRASNIEWRRRWERDQRDIEALMRARNDQLAEDAEQAEIDRIFGNR